jgi:abortive infection bacteriophage resistance protein
MEYNKSPLTYEEQADLLISRKLESNKTTLVDALKNTNYYRFSGYLYPYRKDENSSEEFSENTSLDIVCRHYTFDRRLRFLILDAIERVEVSIRSRLVYYFVHQYGPFEYLNYNNFPNIDEEFFLKYVKNLKYEIGRSKEIFIKHFYEKYGDKHNFPPLWMACELFSFGTLLTFFRGIDKQLKAKLASDLNITDVLLFSWLLSLSNLRNLCAHHGRVWNREYFLKLPTNQFKYKEWFLPINIVGSSKSDGRKIFTILTILKFLLKNVAPNSKWKIRLCELLDEYKDISRKAMGFPKNWKESAIWK